MSTLVMINGEVVPAEEAKISVFDRGFLYGDAVFETIRTYAGLPFALNEHVRRLQWSADRVFIPIPVGLDVIADEIRAATRAAGNPESFIRVMITRGTGETLGLDPELAQLPTRVIIIGPLAVPPPEAYENGISAVTFRTQRLADATAAAGAKVANYLVAVLAMREARQAGAAEALIVDGHGHILEGASSNVFVVREGALITPPEEAGILPGITRALILEVAREAATSVEFRPLSLDEAYAADEVFISSSIRELLPVIRLDGRAVANGSPGPITRLMLQRFREKVRENVALQA
jgi:branched-chain amino acid aminotransferase